MAREAAIRLIEQRYATVHGATPAFLYPHLMAEDRLGRIRAACGYRRASAGPLFLESYLDRPVEHALGEAVGRTIPRRDIIEIGNLAADNAPAMVSLWATAANDLGHDSEFVVAVLTAGLRRMFGRLGIGLLEIMPARDDRLGGEAGHWGSYYANDPVVCAGLIADGQQQLARFARRQKGERA
jgi:hypothetical protein